MGIVMPILVFFISMGATFAYFTARTKGAESDSSTAIIQVNLDGTTKKLNTSTITSTTRVVPGDELVINTKVKNTGTSSIYAIINFKISIVVEMKI